MMYDSNILRRTTGDNHELVSRLENEPSLGTPIDTLAQTVHAFPTTARALSGLFGSAAAKLR